MKRFLGLFFFAAFFSMTAAAESADLPAIREVYTAQMQEAFNPKSCSVSVSYTNAAGSTTTITATVTCNTCTQQAACNAAFAILSIVIPD
ncbi:MAG: hypothetical protein EOO06_17135 [Chitinophagaceae bacterium]|nr:MAG: hypothetical protein EOO06_17135 [Chitinophagaceae bacterium]